MLFHLHCFTLLSLCSITSEETKAKEEIGLLNDLLCSVS